MKTRNIFLLILLFVISWPAVFGQVTASLTHEFSDETDVRTNINTITITIDGDTLNSDIAGNNAAALAFLDGFSGGSSAFNTMLDKLNENNITLSDDDSVAVISFPAEIDYYITADENITFTVPAASLKNSVAAIIASPAIVISNLVSTIVEDNGDLNSGETESAIRGGDNTYTLELENNRWDPTVLSSAAMLTDIKGMFSGGTYFPGMVTSLVSGDLSLSADGTLLTIIFRQNNSFFIPDDELINVTVNQALLEFPESLTNSTEDFTISNENPSISIINQTYTESAIRAGNIDFDITLSGDEWENPLSTAFNTGITTGGGWDSQITPNLTITRTSATVLTVRIPQSPGFNIDATEIVDVVVGAADLQFTNAGSFSAAEHKSITPAAASLSASATFNGVNEGNVRMGTYTIQLTLFEDSWVSEVGTNHNINRDLINGLSFSASQTSAATAMEDAIKDGDNGAVNTNVTGNVVTFTIPAITDFNITNDVDVSFTAPAASLTNTSTNLSTGVFASIARIEPSMIIETVPASPVNSSDLNNATLNVKLIEETWENSSFNRNNFSFTWDPADAATLNISNDGDINYISDDELNITLNFVNTITENKHFRMTVGDSELSGSSSLTSAAPGVSVIAIIEPVITGVSIPNQGMGFGQTVTATLTVNNDMNQEFELVGGTVAGRTVYDLQRINATTYTVKFDIGVAGSLPQYASTADIPYTNLQLRNDTYTGAQFSGSISQNADVLDTDPPSITLVSLNNGTYRIGQTITLTLQATEANLLFDQALTTINTIQLSEANIVSYNAGSGVYQISYTIVENNPDVSSPSSMPLSIVMIDGVGNMNTPVTTYSGANPVIDASPPVISDVTETTNGTVIPGNNVLHTITAGESGLLLADGTIINDVEVGSGRITLNLTGVNTYELVYQVGPNDADVAAGNLNLTVVLKDQAGNTSQFSGVVSDKDLSIVTSTPAATIFGDSEICLGDSATLIINISGGEGPYNVALYQDEVSFNNYLTDGNNLKVKVGPKVNRNYLVYSIQDALGNYVNTTRSIDVLVNALPLVQFSPSIRTVFSLEGGDSYLIPATPSGGLFNGIGVFPEEGRFYPAVAGVADSIAVFYTYTNPLTGCTGKDTTKFTVLPTSGGLTIVYPDAGREGIICYDDPMFEVIGDNVDNFIGSFMLYRRDKGGDVAVPEAVVDPNPNDNRAFIDPSRLLSQSNRYLVSYQYSWKGELIVVEEDIEFDFIREISFSKSIPDAICKDEEAVALEAVPNVNGSFEFTGSGILGNEILGFTFEPDSGLIGPNIINYKYTSSAGCSRSDKITITNFDVPSVLFTPQDVCIPPIDAETGIGGGPIGFNNETTKAALVSSWIWEFGDFNSGSENYDTIPGNGSAPNVIHEYTSPGNRNVSLKILTAEGCDADYSTIIEFADKPDANWRAVSDCWIANEPIEFVNLSKSEKPWNSFVWNINNTAHTWDTTITTTTLAARAEVVFANTEDDYQVELIASNTTGGSLHCYDTLTDLDFVIKRTYDFEGADSKLMTFDGIDEKWTEDSASKYSSWELGEPDFYGFNPEPGNEAWFTRANSSLPESSWIQSQCFDFRGLERPMIRMDVMRSFDQTRDGAVLQYSLDNGTTWVTVGNIGEGINWYNSFDIINRPGGGKTGVGSPVGWSGEDAFNPDTTWVTVAHDLDQLLNERLVIFGIFYATDGASVEENQGFAVDNIYIGERSKRALIEHFTNASDNASDNANTYINNFVETNQLDVTSLQYHMNYPGDDPMNEYNPTPASAKSFFYGVNEVPYALLDGGLLSEYVYDFTPSKPVASQLKKLTLESPLFDMNVKYQIYESSKRISTSVDITAKENIDSKDIILNTAIVQKNVLRDINGSEKEFRNVVLDMLPSTGGFILSRPWNMEDTYRKNYQWSYTDDIDLSELMVVAYLQERATGKILQVATRDSSEFPVNITSQTIQELNIYPNPVRDILYIERDVSATSKGVIQLTDMTGRIVLVEEFPSGDSKLQISTSILSEGNYILNWKENGVITGRSRFVKIQ